MNEPTGIADRLLAEVDWARRLARQLVTDVATADDVVQEAMVQALSHPPAPGPLRPWLGRVVRNAAYMWRRGEGRRQRRERAAQAAEPLPSTDELVGKAEAQRLLADAVVQLDEPYRTTVLLRYFEDLSAAEIARRQGVPAGTVRWRLGEGLARLRSVLDARVGDRRAWCSMLLPLARGPLGRIAVGSASSLTLIGACVMTLKAAAVLGLVGIVWWMVDGGLGLGVGNTSESAVADREPVSFRPLDPPPAAADTGAVRERIEAPRATAGVAVTVRARVLDAGRVPVAGAVLRHAWPGGGAETEAVSDAAGAVTLALEFAAGVLEERGAPARFALLHGGFATEHRSAVLRPGAEVHLGDIVLSPGGAVSGRLIDERGVPVAGARVFVAAREEKRVVGGMISSEEGRTGAAEAVTGADGAFRLSGLLPGMVRVAAAEGERRSESGHVEVRAGQESFGVVVVLRDPPGGEEQIRGLVLDPDGAPCPRADLRYSFTRTFGSGSGGITVGLAGEFTMRDPKPGTYHLVAHDREHRFAAAERRDVGVGDFVVLRLGRAATMRVVLRDDRDRPVRSARIRVRHAEQQALGLGEPIDAASDTGEYELPLPSLPFVVEVEGLGTVDGSFGPFRPEAVQGDPPTLRLVVASAPVVRGRVTIAGQPAAGVGVELFHAARARTTRDGFPIWLEEAPAERGTTDADGTFALTLRGDRPFFLRARRDGFAIAELGPRTDPAGQHDLALTTGGAIRGRVLRGDGRSVAGTVVGVSRGDGAARTFRVGTDGRFEFLHLTPGRWQVVERQAELMPGSTESHSSMGAPYRAETLETRCTVVEGEVTVHDLVLGGPAATAATLRARVVLGNVDLAGWEFTLLSETVPDAEKRLAHGRLDAQGRMQAAVERTGRYQLLVRDPDAPGMFGRALRVPVTLRDGDNQLEVALEAGTVRGSGAPTGEQPPVLLTWQGTGKHAGAVYTCGVRGDARGAFELRGVPAGQVVFRQVPAERARGAEPFGWPVLLRADVPAGAAAALQLRDR